MCKRSGESIDHLFLYYLVARELWCLIFSIFGIQWVMPSGVMELLRCLSGGFGRSQSLEIWRLVPHCLLWRIRREQNASCFLGREQQLLDFKWLVL